MHRLSVLQIGSVKEVIRRSTRKALLMLALRLSVELDVVARVELLSRLRAVFPGLQLSLKPLRSFPTVTEQARVWALLLAKA